MPSTTFQAMLSSVGSKFGARGFDSQNVGMLCAASICMLAPLDLSQLTFALVGALAYAMLQAISPKPAKTHCQLAAERDRERDLVLRKAPWKPAAAKGGSLHFPRTGGSAARARPGISSARAPPATTIIKPEVYQPSSMPVFAPKFESTGWDAEVSELVTQLTPGAADDQAVQRLVLHVKQTIQALYPDVEVTGFAHGSLSCGKAFGVAVPEVDIVANIKPTDLLRQQRMQSRVRHEDAKKLQKAAVRTCTDRLVASGGLKFRRSAFRGEEPRVTLLVPSSLGFFSESVPVDFSINAVTPYYTAALLTECGQMEPRAKSLILLVKRWAKDRGICHAAKGHLSPYLWSLLVMYFMQVGFEEGALLPPLEAFKVASLASSKRKASSPRTATNTVSTEEASKLSVAELFSKFVEFYKGFNWTNEAISIRLGRRAPPGLALPLHVILREDGSTTEVGPSIEDPFNPHNNLGDGMNAISVTRLREELARSCKLCARGASLTEFLEPWVPPEDKPTKSSSDSSPSE